MEDNNDITKLIILVLGVSTIAFFAYMIFKHSQIQQPTQQEIQQRYGFMEQKNQTQTLQSLNQSSIIDIEQKISQLENKINNLSNPIERKSVSMKSPIKNAKEYFGMT